MPEPQAAKAANDPDTVASVVAELEASAPPDPEEPPDETTQEEAPEGDEEGADPDNAEILNTEDEPSPEATEATQEVAEKIPPSKEDPAVARSLAALARKESALRERERLISERERNATASAASLEALRAQAIADPVAFYKALGVSTTADIAAHLYYEEMGDKAPPEWQAKKSQIATQRQVAALKAQLEAKNQAELRAAQETAARNYLLAKTASIPDDLGYLKLEAEENPSSVAESMFRKTQELGAQGRLFGLNDEQISDLVMNELETERVREVERYLKLQEKKIKKATPEEAPKKTVPAKTPSKSVLKQSTTRPQPGANGAARTRAEQIAEVIRDIRAGKHRAS